MNLLTPSGQFGTRMAGGKDHAAPRYIFTRTGAIPRGFDGEQGDAVDVAGRSLWF